MAAKFQEVFGNNGIDDGLYTTAMIVPLGGTNIIALSQGKGLRLESNRQNIKINEIDPKAVPFLVLETITLATMKSATRALPVDARVFQIDGKMLGGGSLGTEVKALNLRTRRPEAKLLVVVLKQRTVKIAVRPVHVRDASNNIVFHSQSKVDFDRLVREMNQIWTPKPILSSNQFRLIQFWLTIRPPSAGL